MGVPGVFGLKGERGPSGPKGSTGPPGNCLLLKCSSQHQHMRRFLSLINFCISGLRGFPGDQGPAPLPIKVPGERGFPGPQGIKGPRGNSGYPGPKGLLGDSGWQ